MASMTSRQRTLTAMRNGIPDRVPVAPDISTYIPLRHSGCTLQDFWTGTKSGIPHWQAYLDAADHYGLDAWTAPVFGLPMLYEEAPVEWQRHSHLDPQRDAMVNTATVRTPEGDLHQESICYRGDQAATTVKLIQDLTTDFARFRYTQPMPRALDLPTLQTYRQACHQRGHAFGVTIPYPGFQMWSVYVQGGVATLAFAEVDTPEILQEWSPGRARRRPSPPWPTGGAGRWRLRRASAGSCSSGACPSLLVRMSRAGPRRQASASGGSCRCSPRRACLPSRPYGRRPPLGVQRPHQVRTSGSGNGLSAISR